MSRLHPRPLALLLGIALAGSIAQAAPPRQPGEELRPATNRRSNDTPVLVYDSLNKRPQGRHVADYIVVRFGPAVSATMRRQITWSLGGRDYVPARFGDFGRVMVQPGESPRALVRRFRKNPDVELAELDRLVYAAEGRVSLARSDQLPQSSAARTRRGAAAAGAVPSRTAQDAGAPTAVGGSGRSQDAVRASGVQAAQNDPAFPFQWHHDRIRTQQVEGLNPSRGSGVTVAVIDTGVLSGGGGNCEANFPAGRGLDLTGTRFVAGRDFVDNDNQPFDEGSRDANAPVVATRFGHGTFVASVIAATADNNFGGAGVAPEVSIMPLRVLGTNGSGTFSDVAEAINFAVANGADVINMSLGGPEGTGVMAQAVANAKQAGVVLVAATGNEGEADGVSFPAAYPAVIAVGASSFDDTVTAYSNRGPQTDVVAPGGRCVRDPVTRQPCIVDRSGGNDIFDAILSPSFLHCPSPASPACEINRATLCGFFWGTGTSFATPQVAAAAALLKAIGVDDPDVIEVLLQNGARDIGAQGFDNQTGHGLLDLVGAHEGFGFSFE